MGNVLFLKFFKQTKQPIVDNKQKICFFNKAIDKDIAAKPAPLRSFIMCSPNEAFRICMMTNSGTTA